MTKEIKVSEIKIHAINPTPKGVVAYVSFTYRNELRINDAAIVTRPKGGFRVLYPYKKLRTKNISSVYPINREVGKVIEDFLLAEYTKKTEGKE